MTLVETSNHSWHSTVVESAAFTLVFMIFLFMSGNDLALIERKEVTVLRIRSCF